MKQFENALEHNKHSFFGARVSGPQSGFGRFNVPITKLVPGKGVSGANGCAQVQTLELFGYKLHGGVEARKYPAVC